jgi:hypothetical protein
MRLAYDASARQYDQDGRLHVRVSHISKANVCPYKGREIPGAEALGLDLNGVYQLLRDPTELAKAAPTFNNLQILSQHIPVSAGAPSRDMTVGSTGTDAAFNAPYLDNSLVFWDAAAIAGVESGELRELSSAYHYVADMTPGEFNGTRYDGVMRNIRGNHVAQVESGRAGSDVIVMDEAMPGAGQPIFSANAAGASAGMAHHAARSDEARSGPGGAEVARTHADAALNYGAALEHYEAGRIDDGHAAHRMAALYGDAASQKEAQARAPVPNPLVPPPLAGDSNLETLMNTRRVTLSPRAAVVKGALMGFLLPRLGKDQKLPNLSAMLASTTAKNWDAHRPLVSKQVFDATRGTLAMDASVDDITGLLDKLAPTDAGEIGQPAGPGGVGRPEDAEVPVANPTDLSDVDPEDTNRAMLGEDDDVADKIREILDGKIDPADMNMVLQLLAPTPADPASDPAAAAPAAAVPPVAPAAPAAKPAVAVAAAKPPVAAPSPFPPKKPATDEVPPQFQKKDDAVDKPAMDAAIRLATDQAVKDAVKQTTERLNSLREAERFVRPWIGDVVVAMDSASDVYKLALETSGVKTAGIHVSAYQAMLSLVPKPGETAPRVRLAQDARRPGEKSLEERFPNIARMRVAG